MRKTVVLGMATLAAALAGGALSAGPVSSASSAAATVQLSRASETAQVAAALIDARAIIFAWSALCPLRAYSSGILLMLR